MAAGALDGNPDAGRQDDLAVGDRKRLREFAQHPLGGDHGVAGGGQLVDQDGKLVAAEARHRVAAAQTAAQAAGERHQQLVAAGVKPAGLGNFVWDDANNNGLQGLVEPGIAGAEVLVFDLA